jgi:hypothetical protein
MMNSVANGVASQEEDDYKDYFLGFVGDRAKPCVDKAIDYTLLVVTLAFQYFRCKDLESANRKCDFSPNWIDFSEKNYIEVLIWVLIGIGISYGILVSAIIWIHSACVPATKIHKKTEDLYKCTDRIFLIDSILEIPISFIEAPIITVSLWSAYAAALGGLYFLTMKFGELVMILPEMPETNAADATIDATIDATMEMNGMNAKKVFVSSAVLVAISLYKFTGEVSQYWVIYTVSKKYAKEDDSKKSYQKKSKVKVKPTNFEEDEESLEFISEKSFDNTFDDEEEGNTVGSGTGDSGTTDGPN